MLEKNAYMRAQNSGVPWFGIGALMPLAAILDVPKPLPLGFAGACLVGDGGMSRRLLPLDESLCTSILGMI